MGQLVSVALCTCDGAVYLRAQLDSLARQTRLPDELVICDDVSRDETVKILEAFAVDAPFPVTIEINDDRLGPVANFGKAAALCKGDIVFFCDQDDVWRDEKIEILSSALMDAEAAYGARTPILVHSDLEVVNERLGPMSPSFFRLMDFGAETHEIADLLNRNVVTGCAAAVNRPLLDLALPVPQAALMHDAWFALCAAAQGAIIRVDSPLVRYRQHGGNQVGAKPFIARLARVLRSPLRQWRDSLCAFRVNLAQAQALAARLAERNCGGTDSSEAATKFASIGEIPLWKRPLLVLSGGYGRYSRAGIPWFLLKAMFV